MAEVRTRAATRASEAAEDGQGEPLAGLAVGAVGEGPAAEVDDVLTGGVAVEDLEQEQVDGGDRVEDAIAPGVFLLLARLLDGLGGEFGGEVLPESAEDGDDTRRHGRAPSGSWWMYPTTRLPGVPPVLKTLQDVQKAEFVRYLRGIGNHSPASLRPLSRRSPRGHPRLMSRPYPQDPRHDHGREGRGGGETPWKQAVRRDRQRRRPNLQTGLRTLSVTGIMGSD